MPSYRPHDVLRHRARSSFLIAALLAAGTAGAQQLEFQGSNLVVNGTFDSSLAGWTEEQHSDYTSNWISYEGFGDLGGSLLGEGKTDPPPERHHIAWQCMTVKPGRNYRFEGALKSTFDDEVVISGGRIALFRATQVGCAEDGEALHQFALRRTLGANPWEPNGATVRIPSGVTRVQVATIADAGNFIDDARQEHQSNFVAFDAIALREELGDFVARFGPGIPSSGSARQVVTIPLEIENRSIHEAHSSEFRFEDRNRFTLRSETCPGSFVRIEQGANSYYRWQNFGSPFSARGKVTCSAEFSVKDGASGADPLRLTATSDNDWNIADNTVTSPYSVVARPDVAVEVSTTPFPQPGQAVTANVTFRNLGTAAATTPVLTFEWTDESDARVTLSGYTTSCSGFTYESGAGLGSVSLAAGASQACAFGFTWPAGGVDDLTFTVAASQSQDYDLSNNVASDVSQLLRLRLNSTSDTPDAVPGDGRCETVQNAATPVCTLRAAIMEANAVAGTQTIEIPVLGGPYRLTRSSTNGGDHGDVQLSGSARLVGEPLGGQNPRLELDFPVNEPGRAIRVESTAGTVRISNLDIVGQNLAFAGDGGLIEHRGGKLSLRDLSLTNGRAQGKGGAIHATGELEMFGVTLATNTSPQGGALAFEPSVFEFLEVADSRFSGNGGADTTEGGALWLTRGLVGIDASTFDANRADRGGAIHAGAGNFGTLVFNSTLSGNLADLEGGAIHAGSGVALNTSTVADNHATQNDPATGLGGGVYVASGTTVSVYGSIFVGNTGQVRTASGPGGIQLSFPHAAACHGALDSDGYNSLQAISQDQLCTATATTGDHFDTFASLAALADNGGPTPTRALVTTGNEVDRGAPDCLASPGGSALTADQRGSARPADGDGDGAARCDKGAFERADAARLTVLKAGSAQGFVSSTPASIFCGATCTAAFAANQSVTLTAQPSSGHRFAGWSGACTGTGTSCTLAVAGDVTVTATFEDLASQTLAVSLGGTGAGSVASAPSGIACPGDCSEGYALGASVTLTATPVQGSVFAGWSGDCSGTGACAIAMDGSRQAIAQFDATSHPLEVQLDGDGLGTIASSDVAIDCPFACAIDVPAGTAATLVATAAAGSTFAGWTGGPCAGSTSASCAATVDAPTTLVARFETLADPTLEVEVLGDGSVASTPAGLACPGICSAAFARDSAVTLTATATAGQVFEQWRTGPCAGSSSPSCIVTLDQSQRVRVQFAPQGTTLDAIFANGYE